MFGNSLDLLPSVIKIEYGSVPRCVAHYTFCYFLMTLFRCFLLFTSAKHAVAHLVCIAGS